jgi:hypothetical protein
MKKIMPLIIISFLFLNVKGQEFNDSLYFHLYNYQIISGELKSKIDRQSLNKSFNIEELVDKTNTGCFKIYKFYNLIYEESSISFLIIQNEKVEIYNILSYSALIERILDESTCNENTKVLLIKEVLKILRHYYEDADMGSLVMRKDYGKYLYFIPLKKLKNKEVNE